MSTTSLLDQTGELHRLLPTPPLTRPIAVHHQTDLPLNSKTAWQHRDRGSISTDGSAVTLHSPTRYESWPQGAPADGDYIQYGQIGAFLPLDHEDWRQFDQVLFSATVHNTGVINANITLAFKNDGAIKVPDQYMRVGFHSVDLISDGKAHVYHLNIADLPRDAISEISLNTTANGSYLNLPGEIDMTFDHFTLANAEQQPVTHGWAPQVDTVITAQVGYPTWGQKIALLNCQTKADHFELIAADDKPIFTGDLTLQEIADVGIKVADFSTYQVPGNYRLRIPGLPETPITIAENAKLWQTSVLDDLNFIYSQRCGFPVPGLHPTCHTDVFAQHNGLTMPFNGGWHDAGDLSQQTMQTAEVTLSLLQTAKAYRKTDARLSARLVEEAQWGADFVLKTRFGDGYRATSAGTSRWTDNAIGNFDDVNARVHNSAYDNFLFAGIEAQASALMPEPMQAHALKLAAISDYAFAQATFGEHPYAPEPIMWEHTYNTSKASYDATIVWTAAQLYDLTQTPSYQQDALQAGQRLLTYQETDGLTLDDGQVIRGAFYRDETHQVFQHFNHQAREHLFAQALDVLITLSNNDAKFMQAARNYGDYLLWLEHFTAPYPMVASGLYRDDEPKDKDSFYHQHLLVDQSAETEYTTQLQNGIQVAPHLFVKRFPVWFSFRGNNGVILSTAQSAAILAKALKDEKLAQLAENQLAWVSGLNPFGQSLMYGLGSRFENLYAASCGQQVGALPVGIETAGDEDIPFWPQFNNATYKEVWIGNNGKWLAVIAALQNAIRTFTKEENS